VIADKKSARTVKAIERSYSKVRVVFELGRCLDPIDMEEKKRIEENARYGQELARLAKKIYLVREENLTVLK
jgi:hypothetical protein